MIFQLESKKDWIITFQNSSFFGDDQIPNVRLPATFPHLSNEDRPYQIDSHDLANLVSYMGVHSGDLLACPPIPYAQSEVWIRAHRDYVISGGESGGQTMIREPVCAFGYFDQRWVRIHHDFWLRRFLGKSEYGILGVRGKGSNSLPDIVRPTPKDTLLLVLDLVEHDVKAGTPSQNVISYPNDILEFTTACPSGLPIVVTYRHPSRNLDNLKMVTNLVNCNFDLIFGNNWIEIVNTRNISFLLLGDLGTFRLRFVTTVCNSGFYPSYFFSSVTSVTCNYRPSINYSFFVGK